MTHEHGLLHAFLRVFCIFLFWTLISVGAYFICSFHLCGTQSENFLFALEFKVDQLITNMIICVVLKYAKNESTKGQFPFSRELFSAHF